MRALLLALAPLLCASLSLHTSCSSRASLAPASRRATSPQLNFFENLKQLSDQRVASVSHVMLRTDPAACALRTKGEAYELLSAYKETIKEGSDEAEREERFRICAAERSECASKDKPAAGDLGFVTRGKLASTFDEVIFTDGECPRVEGPIETKDGLHLVFVKTCREPSTDNTAKTYPQWMKNMGIGND